GEQVEEGLLQSLAAEALVEGARLLGRLDVGPGHAGEQGKPGQELRRQAADGGAQRHAGRGRSALRVEVEALAQQDAHRRVRHHRLVLLADDAEQSRSRCATLELLDESRLAGAGRADHLDAAAGAREGGPEVSCELLQLVVATDQWPRAGALVEPARRHRTDAVRTDRVRLALD